MTFEASKSKPKTMTKGTTCKTVPAKFHRIKHAVCEIGPNDVNPPWPRKTTPTDYVQALAAGECGPDNQGLLEANVNAKTKKKTSFGDYINAGHVLAHNLGGQGTAWQNFFPQNKKENSGGIWYALEACITVCLKTTQVPSSATTSNTAKLTWDFNYISKQNLYPNEITYQYELAYACWVIGTTGSYKIIESSSKKIPTSYNFDPKLAIKAWGDPTADLNDAENSEARRWLTNGVEGCDKVRGSSAHTLSVNGKSGAVLSPNDCGAPCGPGSNVAAGGTGTAC